MPKSENQKLKILYILDYLKKESSKDHPVKTAELLDMLDLRHNISCDRKTVYDDIRALNCYGAKIISKPGKNGGYYVTSQTFKLSELKLLIDAVQSSRFLTEDMSRDLIKKLLAQCNENDAKLMMRNVLVSGRVKTMNDSIYYNVDAIQEAIANTKQISFRYFDWDFKGQRKYREKSYEASPYGLFQDNENYYLLALSDRHGITSYRVDRMTDIQISKKPRVYCKELTGKGLVEEATRRFNMYSGNITNVKMRFHNDLLNVVIDRFGTEPMFIPDGDYFNITVPVAVSPMFLSWIIGFGSQAKILFPQSVADQLQELCRKATSQY